MQSWGRMRREVPMISRRLSVFAFRRGRVVVVVASSSIFVGLVQTLSRTAHRFRFPSTAQWAAGNIIEIGLPS